MRISVSSFLSPKGMTAFMAVLMLLLANSPNFALWAALLFSMPLALYFLGGRKATPVLVWIIAMYWLSLLGDIAVADLGGKDLAQGFQGTFQVRAMLYSVVAMIVLAMGMKNGDRWGARRFHQPPPDKKFAYGINVTGISLNRALIAYAASFVIAAVGSFMTQLLPVLAQAFVALSFIKLITIYIIAGLVIESDKGWRWLFLIALFEIASGAISYFSAYKEAVIIILLALASTRRKVPLAYCVLSFVAIALVIWLSVAWSSVKGEYRDIIGNLTTEQKIDWIYQRYTSKDLDYAAASIALLTRIGYTNFFTVMLSREDAGTLPSGDEFYVGAVENIFMPRVLFPDKPVLDDTAITERLTGIYIGRKTSAGVGYTAQAYADFGFPLMLLPLWLIGVLLGLLCRYFLTRSAPKLVRYGFATVALYQLFPYAGQIDKEVGATAIYFIEMSLILKVGYPMFGRWLAGGRLDFGGARPRQQIEKFAG